MLGFSEILVICSVGVLVLGWRRIPQIGSSLRKTLMGFQSGLKGESEKKNTRDVEELSRRNKPTTPPHQ